MKNRQAGFTLIELMIVVGIIGILAVVALRSANGYAVRAKVSEAMLALSTCKTVITELYLTGDSVPMASPDSWGCEGSNQSKFVDTINTSPEGIVKVGLRGFGDLRLDFHTITLAPLDSTGALMSANGRVARWRCGAAADGTDVSDLALLPSTCQGI